MPGITVRVFSENAEEVPPGVRELALLGSDGTDYRGIIRPGLPPAQAYHIVFPSGDDWRVRSGSGLGVGAGGVGESSEQVFGQREPPKG